MHSIQLIADNFLSLICVGNPLTRHQLSMLGGYAVHFVPSHINEKRVLRFPIYDIVKRMLSQKNILFLADIWLQ